VNVNFAFILREVHDEAVGPNITEVFTPFKICYLSFTYKVVYLIKPTSGSVTIPARSGLLEGTTICTNSRIVPFEL
jgi:hypothetical protein